jgi:hypothetical protein
MSTKKKMPEPELENTQADEEEDEAEGHGEPDGDEGKKSLTGVTPEDLQKGLDKLDAYAAGTSTSRKDVLLSKATTNELSKSEKDELFRLLGGDSAPADEASLASQVTKGLADNPSLQKAFDVSDFLAEQNAQLVKSLGDLSAAVEQDGARQQEFNLILAKAVVDTGRHVAAMAQRLGIIEAQPARAPKSRLSGAQPLNKGFGGAAPDGENLTKGQALRGLEDMMKSAMTDGRNGLLKCGYPIDVAVAELESGGTIPASVQTEIREHLSKR